MKWTYHLYNIFGLEKVICVCTLLSSMEWNDAKPNRFRYCPVCGTSQWSFIPCGRNVSSPYQQYTVSSGYRSGCKCAICGARERHRLLWLYLQRNDILDVSTARILHFSPTNSLRDRLGDDSRIDWVSIDLKSENSHVNADIQDLPFSNDSFDIIICSHILEHVPNDIKALREIRRVLSESGIALFLVPLNWNISTKEDPSINDPEIRRRKFCQENHVRLYGPDIIDRFQSAGLNLLSSDFARSLSPVEQFYFGINENEPFFVCASSNIK